MCKVKYLSRTFGSLVCMGFYNNFNVFLVISRQSVHLTGFPGEMKPNLITNFFAKDGLLITWFNKSSTEINDLSHWQYLRSKVTEKFQPARGLNQQAPGIQIKGWERNKSKCFFTFIHLDFFCSQPSKWYHCWWLTWRLVKTNKNIL